MHPLKQLLEGVEHLFFPQLCAGCGSDMLPRDHLLCTRCITRLPHTGYAAMAGNPTEKIFWGRLPLVAAASEFYFSKSTVIQQLIHSLKYKGNRAIGQYLGAMMAETLVAGGRFSGVDALVPLPMHPAREKQRGYNQAAVLCEGMQQITGIPLLQQALVKGRKTSTQTRKHRTERWENAEGSFVLLQPEQVRGKHLLLVDDVVTTGATLEAAGRSLLCAAGVKLSIATLATALK